MRGIFILATLALLLVANAIGWFLVPVRRA
jgi:hypothetical protein